MKILVAVYTLLLICAPALFAQNPVRHFDSDTAKDIGSDHMAVSPETFSRLSSGPFDKDPLSSTGELLVSYETRDAELCRAALAASVASVIEEYPRGEWLVDISCIVHAAKVELDFSTGSASGYQWPGETGDYAWRNSWTMQPDSD